MTDSLEAYLRSTYFFQQSLLELCIVVGIGYFYCCGKRRRGNEEELPEGVSLHADVSDAHGLVEPLVAGGAMEGSDIEGRRRQGRSAADGKGELDGSSEEFHHVSLHLGTDYGNICAGQGLVSRYFAMQKYHNSERGSLEAIVIVRGSKHTRAGKNTAGAPHSCE